MCRYRPLLVVLGLLISLAAPLSAQDAALLDEVTLAEALKVSARQERVLTPAGENEISAIVVVGGLIYAVVFVTALFAPETSAVGYGPQQPVPYSHALHVGEIGAAVKELVGARQRRRQRSAGQNRGGQQDPPDGGPPGVGVVSHRRSPRDRWGLSELGMSFQVG